MNVENIWYIQCKMQVIRLLFILITILNCSCADDKVTDITFDRATAFVNDQQFEFRTFCFQQGGEMSVSLNEKKTLKYFIDFGNIQMKEYIIDTLASSDEGRVNNIEYVFLATTIGGDVLESSYHPDPNSLNRLEIVSFDENEREVRGQFNLVMLIDSSHMHQDPAIPDTLIIRNGEFQARIR